MLKEAEYQEILKKYKKSNQYAKTRMLNKLKFTDPDTYKKLTSENKPPKEEKSKKKILIHNVDILDGSTSMYGGKFNNGLKGINTGIEKMKDEKLVDYTETFVVFGGNRTTPLHWKTPINMLNNVDGYSSGGTPLFQVMGETLERLEKEIKPNEKVLVNIFTDGEENQSAGVWKSENGNGGWGVVPKNRRLSQLINRLKEKGFTITFVGTQGDVSNMIKSFEIDESNTLVHDNTAQGVADSFGQTFMAREQYSKSVAKGENVLRGFYKKVGKL